VPVALAAVRTYNRPNATAATPQWAVLTATIGGVVVGSAGSDAPGNTFKGKRRSTKNTHFLTIFALQNALKLTCSNLEFRKFPGGLFSENGKKKGNEKRER